MRLVRLAMLLAAAGWVLAVHMIVLAGAAPTVRHASVHMAGWPAGAPPIRAVLISDLHVATPGNSPERLAATIDAINRLRPDLVLLAGDILSTGATGLVPTPPRRAVALLAGLRPRLGTYAVMGNHDYIFPDDVRRGLAAIGAHLIENDAVRVGPLAILGLSDDFSRHADIPRTVAAWQRIGGVPVLLTHSPDASPALPPAIRLALAGHTHCGQISLPLIGAPVTKSRYGARYACGIVREGDRTTIVSGGLGESGAPIRLGVGPELYLVTLGR